MGSMALSSSTKPLLAARVLQHVRQGAKPATTAEEGVLLWCGLLGNPSHLGGAWLGGLALHVEQAGDQSGLVSRPGFASRVAKGTEFLRPREIAGES